MKSDLEIAREAKVEPIEQVAKRYGIQRGDLELYGDVKAKVKLSILERPWLDLHSSTKATKYHEELQRKATTDAHR